MKKKKLLALISILIVTSCFYISSNIHSNYNLSEIERDGWIFRGGSVSIDQEGRRFSYSGIDYVGDKDIEVTQVSVKILGYSNFLKVPDIYALGSVEYDESYTIDNSFKYGGGSGHNRGSNFFKAYLLDSVVVQIDLMGENHFQNVILEVPVKAVN